MLVHSCSQRWVPIEHSSISEEHKASLLTMSLQQNFLAKFVVYLAGGGGGSEELRDVATSVQLQLPLHEVPFGLMV